MSLSAKRSQNNTNYIFTDKKLIISRSKTYEITLYTNISSVTRDEKPHTYDIQLTLEKPVEDSFIPLYAVFIPEVLSQDALFSKVKYIVERAKANEK